MSTHTDIQDRVEDLVEDYLDAHQDISYLDAERVALRLVIQALVLRSGDRLSATKNGQAAGAAAVAVEFLAQLANLRPTLHTAEQGEAWKQQALGIAANAALTTGGILAECWYEGI